METWFEMCLTVSECIYIYFTFVLGCLDLYVRMRKIRKATIIFELTLKDRIVA